MRTFSASLSTAIAACLFIAAPITGCGGGDSSGTGATGGGGSGGTTQGGGGQGGGGQGGGGQGGQGGSQTTTSSTCAQIVVEATTEEQPPDIIFVVGNNGSLAQEIAAVEDNINANFAQIIEQSGIDYRMILLSRSGSHQFNMCVEAPLGGVPAGECATQLNNAPPVNNPDRFFHYSAIVNSDDSWCKLLGTFDGKIPDEYGQAPGGWSEWLRPEAFKVFVLISDSSTNCLHAGTDLDDGPQQPNQSNIPGAEMSAAQFDAFLLGLSAEHFGTPEKRNYQFHSIVGLASFDPNDPTTPWLASDPLSLVKCTGDTNPVSPALGYQALSRLSGGLRFPICEYKNFDVVFKQIAQNIIASVNAIGCEFPLPEPPAGETLDPSTIQMKFTPPGGMEQVFNKVPAAGDCKPDSFYIENKTIHLCPETCAEVQSAGAAAQLDVAFGCEIVVPN